MGPVGRKPNDKLAAKVQTLVNVNKDKGATAVEYGLMVALIAVVIIGAVAALGGKISNMFNDVATETSVIGGVAAVSPSRPPPHVVDDQGGWVSTTSSCGPGAVADSSRPQGRHTRAVPLALHVAPSAANGTPRSTRPRTHR